MRDDFTLGADEGIAVRAFESVVRRLDGQFYAFALRAVAGNASLRRQNSEHRFAQQAVARVVWRRDVLRRRARCRSGQEHSEQNRPHCENHRVISVWGLTNQAQPPGLRAAPCCGVALRNDKPPNGQ